MSGVVRSSLFYARRTIGIRTCRASQGRTGQGRWGVPPCCCSTTTTSGSRRIPTGRTRWVATSWCARVSRRIARTLGWRVPPATTTTGTTAGWRRVPRTLRWWVATTCLCRRRVPAGAWRRVALSTRVDRGVPATRSCRRVVAGRRTGRRRLAATPFTTTGLVAGRWIPGWIGAGLDVARRIASAVRRSSSRAVVVSVAHAHGVRPWSRLGRTPGQDGWARAPHRPCLSPWDACNAMQPAVHTLLGPTRVVVLLWSCPAPSHRPHTPVEPTWHQGSVPPGTLGSWCSVPAAARVQDPL